MRWRRRRSGSDGYRLATPDDQKRQERIDALVAKVASRLGADDSMDQAAIEGAHADLMPELGQRLRDLRMLNEAGRRARQMRLASFHAWGRRARRAS